MSAATFAFVTLGCPKNEADSDRLRDVLAAAGHRPAAASCADLVIVNTCGFIDAAKEESIEALLDACEAAASTGAKVAAMGCLVERYRDELQRELPEVDVFTGFDVEPLLEALGEIAIRAGRGAAGTAAPRPARALHAYVKISDGCDRWCAFCAIPLIKGDYHVVPADEILRRATLAVERGARELVLVGQDTARWQQDGYGGPARLLSDLSRLGASWLRLLYLQPENVSEALLEALAACCVPYVDIPLQHASASVLRRMGRGGDAQTFVDLVAGVRGALPGAALRTTFITGFPGETERDVDELVEFIAEVAPAVAGVFPFDPQEGTRAAAMPDQVPAALREARAVRVGRAIERAAAGFWESQLGRRVDVLVTAGTRNGGGRAVGRIALQAPDIDGVTHLQGAPVRRGTIIPAVVEDVIGYDLIATLDS